MEVVDEMFNLIVENHIQNSVLCVNPYEFGIFRHIVLGVLEITGRACPCHISPTETCPKK